MPERAATIIGVSCSKRIEARREVVLPREPVRRHVIFLLFLYPRGRLIWTVIGPPRTCLGIGILLVVVLVVDYKRPDILRRDPICLLIFS